MKHKMKIIMKKHILTIFLFTLILSSCKDLTELNINPNNVPETHPRLLLTDIEWNAFQIEGVDPLFASRMAVQTDGEDANQYYKWTRSDFGAYNQLRNVTKMIEEAERIESPVYVALGKFFRAYYFLGMTLTFGDIPYNDALKGETSEIYTPSYNTQKDVFKGILKELAEADAILAEDNSIIAGDIIYNGSAEKWRKCVNSYRLKVLMMLSEKVADSDLNVATSFASVYNNSPLIESNTESGQLMFIDELGSRYTEYNSSSYGSARYMDSTFVKRLQDRKDPRLFIFCGQTRVAKESGLAINDFAAYEGGDPIAPYNNVNLKAAKGLVSKINLRYTTNPTTEPSVFMGYPELQFILAEASLRGWINSSAKEHYENGVKASFGFYNSYATDYAQFVNEEAAETYLAEPLVDFSKATDNDRKLELIIMQKYFTSFLQGGWRMYLEHLRTGYPGFRTQEGVTPPVRWMYPTSEYQYNSENVKAAITRQFGENNDDTRKTPWWLQ